MALFYFILSLSFAFFLFRFFLNKHKKVQKVYSLKNKVILELRTPKVSMAEHNFKFSAMAMESFYSSIHGLLKSLGEEVEVFSFEIVSKPEEGIKFYVVCSNQSASFVESQLYANYPNLQVLRVQDNLGSYAQDFVWKLNELKEVKSHIFPLKTYVDLEVDSMAAITSAMSQPQEGEIFALQVIARPVGDIWQKEGNEYVSVVKTGKKPKESSKGDSILINIIKEFGNIFVKIITEIVIAFGGLSSQDSERGSKSNLPSFGKLSVVQEMELNAVENKMTKMGFAAQIRFLVCSKSYERVQYNIGSLVASMNQFSTANLNGLMVGDTIDGFDAYKTFVDRTFNEQRSYILNVEELSSVFHLPSQMVETPNIVWSYSKKTEPPANLPTQNCTYIGETLYRDQKVRFGISHGDDRLRHMYIIGKSGTGKSTIFETMISQDIANGFGVGVLDPHGETIDRILERIPDERVDDVIYFDPSDVDYPVGLNLLEMQDLSQKNIMASALVSAIKHHFDYSWGPRLEYLLNYAILTLLEVQGTTMLGITRLMEDDNYRNFILYHVKDPLVLKFWETEFKNMKSNPKLITEAVAPIQNKVNRFLASSTIRNILGQRKSTIDIEWAMNNGKILLMNLSKGKIGEDNANLLGALLVSRIQFFALQRAKIPPEQRRPFYLYVDEFQNFATGSFESILSESRKYGLGLYLTHQYTAQLPENLLKAVLGNVGTIITFALGAPDAKVLQAEFAPFFTETDIISLERFQIYVKLMMNGMTSLPFSARILRPWVEEECIVPKTNNKEWILELSRQKYGSDRIVVEDRIRKWVDTPFDKGMAISIKSKAELASSSSLDLVSSLNLSNQTPQKGGPVFDDSKVPDIQHSKDNKNNKDNKNDKNQRSLSEIPNDSKNAILLGEGYFDGEDVVFSDGRKYLVWPNYAAKSELVYGDIIEVYKEGEDLRFKQKQKMPRKQVIGILQKKEDDNWFLFDETSGKYYRVSKTAVEFNNFKEGQKMYGIVPENIQDPPFCALGVRKYRKQMKKVEEAAKISQDQSLR